jgi:hypothetical protein
VEVVLHTCHHLQEQTQTIHHRLGQERQRVLLLQPELERQTIHHRPEPELQRVPRTMEPVQLLQSHRHHQRYYPQVPALLDSNQRGLLLDSPPQELRRRQTNHRQALLPQVLQNQNQRHYQPLEQQLERAIQTKSQSPEQEPVELVVVLRQRYYRPESERECQWCAWCFVPTLPFLYITQQLCCILLLLLYCCCNVALLLLYTTVSSRLFPWMVS